MPREEYEDEDPLTEAEAVLTIRIPMTTEEALEVVNDLPEGVEIDIEPTEYEDDLDDDDE